MATIYQCDRCKKQVAKSNLDVLRTAGVMSPDTAGTRIADLCEDCLTLLREWVKSASTR